MVRRFPHGGRDNETEDDSDGESAWGGRPPAEGDPDWEDEDSLGKSGGEKAVRMRKDGS